MLVDDHPEVANSKDSHNPDQHAEFPPVLMETDGNLRPEPSRTLILILLHHTTHDLGCTRLLQILASAAMCPRMHRTNTHSLHSSHRFDCNHPCTRGTCNCSCPNRPLLPSTAGNTSWVCTCSCSWHGGCRSHYYAHRWCSTTRQHACI